MIAIGERINGQFTDVKKAIADKDKSVIEDWAKRQTAAGAKYLDINVGTAAADQKGTMQWLVETAQEAVSTPLCLDSQKVKVIAAGLEVADTARGVLLNSTPLDKKSDMEVMDKYLELAEKNNGSVICLTMDHDGIPQDVDKRVEIAANIVTKAMELGFPTERLFIDPIIMPVNVPGAQQQPGYILEAISQIRFLADPAPHITCGLSNLSQGTVERALINRIFLAMAMTVGLDSAIVDVCDEPLVDAVATAEILLNKQIFSDSYLKAYRAMQAGT